jgi:hypothetical protein
VVMAALFQDVDRITTSRILDTYICVPRDPFALSYRGEDCGLPGRFP